MYDEARISADGRKLTQGIGSYVKMVPDGMIKPGTIPFGPDTGDNWQFAGFSQDGGKNITALYPTYADGRKLSDQQAIDRYLKTGQHYGLFDTGDNAYAYVQKMKQIKKNK